MKWKIVSCFLSKLLSGSKTPTQYLDSHYFLGSVVDELLCEPTRSHALPVGRNRGERCQVRQWRHLQEWAGSTMHRLWIFLSYQNDSHSDARLLHSQELGVFFRNSRLLSLLKPRLRSARFRKDLLTQSDHLVLRGWPTLLPRCSRLLHISCCCRYFQVHNAHFKLRCCIMRRAGRDVLFLFSKYDFVIAERRHCDRLARHFQGAKSQNVRHKTNDSHESYRSAKMLLQISKKLFP